MKYALCNIHINDFYSKYFVYDDSNFILFHCIFTYSLLYDGGRHFSVLSDFKMNVNCL